MWPLALRRLRYRRRVAGTELEACWLESQSLGGSSFLVCDAEMSSLELDKGELLSLGWVLVEEGAVQLVSARHRLIKPSGSVGQSAAIHQLRDCELEDAADAQTALSELLRVAAGRVLVFHHASLDLAYLNRLCLQTFQAPLLLPVVDTMAMEQRILGRRDQALRPGDLRLQACRSRYGLPDYPAHNALVDALATAELLLAQIAHGLDVA